MPGGRTVGAMKTQEEYMVDRRIDERIIQTFAKEILHDREIPCGWSWDLTCQLECPLRDRQELMCKNSSDERLKCMFDGSLLNDAERLFLARTWNAVQLMGMELGADR